MDSAQIQTDRRLLSILGSGEYFLSYIDPQGLLDGAVPNLLQIELDSKSWLLRLIYENGNEAILHGGIKDKVFFITSFEPSGMKEGEKIPLKPSNSFAKALGDLSRVPAPIKPYLSRDGLKNRKEIINATAGPVPFMKNAQDALFFKIDDIDGGSVNYFRKWKFNYVLSERGSVIGVGLAAYYKKSTSVISLSTEVDIYGIGNKKVTLSKTVGENHFAAIDCTCRQNEKYIPSVKLALELDRMIKNPWSTERIDNKKIGPSPKK